MVEDGSTTPPRWVQAIQTAFPPAVRQYLYSVLLATIPLLLVYGIIDGSAVALWVGLAGAVLGLGTATAAITSQRRDGTLP